MAKKRPQETQENVEVNTDHAVTDHGDASDQSTETQALNEPFHPLLKEVHSHLNQRDELLEKLDAEIEAMEQKLAELRETAALLKPENNGTAKEASKVKKAKPKSAKEEKTVAAISSDNASAAEE
jgi:hypothetical protein